MLSADQLDMLSADQKAIYDLVTRENLSVSQLAERLNKPTGIVRAQITRIRNRRDLGLSDFDVIGYNDDAEDAIDVAVGTATGPGTFAPTEEVVQRPETRPDTSKSSNETVVDEAINAGPPNYNVEEVIKQVQAQGGLRDDEKDVHPMILFGLTIQFCRLAGGRMHAHQLIEDIYGAIRTMNGDSRAESTLGTKPWPPSESKNLSAVLESIDSLKQAIQGFQGSR